MSEANGDIDWKMPAHQTLLVMGSDEFIIEISESAVGNEKALILQKNFLRDNFVAETFFLYWRIFCWMCPINKEWIHVQKLSLTRCYKFFW